METFNIHQFTSFFFLLWNLVLYNKIEILNLTTHLDNFYILTLLD